MIKMMTLRAAQDKAAHTRAYLMQEIPKYCAPEQVVAVAPTLDEAEVLATACQHMGGMSIVSVGLALSSDILKRQCVVLYNMHDSAQRFALYAHLNRVSADCDIRVVDFQLS